MKILNALAALFVSALFCVQTCSSYHVLMYHNIGTKSHVLQYEPLVEELLARESIQLCSQNHLRTQVLRKTQVAPSGHFLVARTNFGMSFMARKGRGRHRNCPKKWQVPISVKKLTCPLGFLMKNSG